MSFIVKDIGLIMPPELLGIDHIHVYTANRDAAFEWYSKVLGFTVIEELRFWATESGPLTITDKSGVHLALFERENFTPASVLAMGCSGAEFFKWKTYLQEQGILENCKDHDKSWSLYFNDMDGNSLEITTNDHEYVTNNFS
jgi:catechol 2,3-dioxygenase-like lactoylglutathione lyase family enzyme